MPTYIYITLSSVLGALVAYLYMKAISVRRSMYEQQQRELIAAQNKLDTHLTFTQELRQQLANIQQVLTAEKEKNIGQEKELAALRASAQTFQTRFLEERETNTKQQQSIDTHHGHIINLKTSLSELTTINQSLQEKIDRQQDEFEQQRKQSLATFENIANKIFTEKTDRFSQTSQEKIEQLLHPLKEDLQQFKKKVEDTYDKESKQRFSLEDKIKELVALNQQVSQEANNLTNALKSQVKTQGNWGEMILENILEASGLVKGREYFTQTSYTDAEGRKKQPDVKIKYPDDRYVIIDAKVSLVAYERFINCEDADEQKMYLAQHIQSVRQHIDNLHTKEYDQFTKALDFVFLFIPIEPAFLTAIQYDTQLWQYAYKKRIVIMSPTNLIATLKLIQDIWKREHQNQNAKEIAKRGGALYDKFVGFVQDMDDIGKSLNKTNEKYNQAFNKLSKGNGNLIGQVEKLRTLGVDHKKKLN